MKMKNKMKKQLIKKEKQQYLESMKMTISANVKKQIVNLLIKVIYLKLKKGGNMNIEVIYINRKGIPNNKNDPGIIFIGSISTNKDNTIAGNLVAMILYINEVIIKIINNLNFNQMIKIKIVEQKTFNPKNDEKMSNAFVVRQIYNGTKRSKEVIEHCANTLMVPKTYVAASIEALALSTKQYLRDGHSVEIPGFGIFSTSIGYKSVTSSQDTGVEQVEEIRINFLPCKELKAAIQDVEIDVEGIYAYIGEVAGLPNSDGSTGENQKVYQRIKKNDNYTTNNDTKEDVTPDDNNNPETDSGNGENNDSGNGGGFAG